MRIIRTRRALLKYRRGLSGSVGFVPTMGALHEGHLSLVRRARKECQYTIVSIFVNPTQFGPHEDYLKYPRPERADVALLKGEKCDAVFIPKAVEEVYARGDETSIRARVSLTRILCGPLRPGHFDGVCTVVYKLFQWVAPDRAYFGLKDYQQVKVIEAMVKDLNLGVRIVPCPTRREKSGLALSSRNQYLSPAHQDAAAILYSTLSSAKSIAVARQQLARAGFKVQYLESRSEDLETLNKGPSGRWLFAGFFHGVRLIDNLKREGVR